MKEDEMFATPSLFAAFVGFLVLTALPASSIASHSWGNYHWARQANPFTLNLGDNVSSAWTTYLWTASSEWSKSTVLNTIVVPGGTKPKPCKPTAGQVDVCAATYGFNGWLGLAQIWISGNHITHGITKLNDSYFNTAKYNTTAWRNLVICQEIGHTFGLDHQDENFSNTNLGTCMDYTNNPSSNQYPNAHDFQQLQTIYTHLDGSTTVLQSSQTGKPAADAEDELEVGTAQWGRLVRSTNRGRTELFELDLGGGHKKFTFVIWADPEDQPGAGRGRR
jgi:hypothetical protein